MRIKSLRPNPGVLIGTIALVFALTGAAAATSKVQKIHSEDIAKRAVTGSKVARDAIKGGKIANGKVKAKDLAPNVIPDVATTAYGRVNKNGANVAPGSGAVGITGVASGGAGVICYDLATKPVSGSVTVATDTNSAGSTATMLIGAGAGCADPYTDAQTTTTSAASVGTAPYQEGSAANRDVYVEFIGG